MGKKETEFQNKLMKEIETRIPGAVARKFESYVQGDPDLFVFYGKHWAALECKREKDAARQPNQDYYVNKFDSMSFARVIYPENKEEVLNELQRSFES